MQLSPISIEEISKYRSNIILVNFTNLGIIPFKWYEDEEAWLFEPKGKRLNIDHVWDSKNDLITEVAVVV